MKNEIKPGEAVIEIGQERHVIHIPASGKKIEIRHHSTRGSKFYELDVSKGGLQVTKKVR